MKNAGFRKLFSDAVWAKAEHVLAPLGDVPLPAPCGWNVLIAQWTRREKTRGGIILTAKSTDEDRYQGRCGIVLAVGPDAYTGEKYTAGPWCKVGDWVAWPAMENAASRMTYAGQTVTVIPDDRVLLVGIDPDQVS